MTRLILAMCCAVLLNHCSEDSPTKPNPTPLRDAKIELSQFDAYTGDQLAIKVFDSHTFFTVADTIIPRLAKASFSWKLSQTVFLGKRYEVHVFADVNHSTRYEEQDDAGWIAVIDTVSGHTSVSIQATDSQKTVRFTDLASWPLSVALDTAIIARATGFSIELFDIFYDTSFIDTEITLNTDTSEYLIDGAHLTQGRSYTISIGLLPPSATAPSGKSSWEFAIEHAEGATLLWLK